MRKVLALGIVTGVLFGGATMAVADPGVPNIPAHRHFVLNASGKQVEVGPRLCDNASLQHAFNQFHINVHSSATSPTTPIDTLGPQHGAPGLHNFSGGELRPGPC
jgi:hypothetical protein